MGFRCGGLTVIRREHQKNLWTQVAKTPWTLTQPNSIFSVNHESPHLLELELGRALDLHASDKHMN